MLNPYGAQRQHEQWLEEVLRQQGREREVRVVRQRKEAVQAQLRLQAEQPTADDGQRPPRSSKYRSVFRWLRLARQGRVRKTYA